MEAVVQSMFGSRILFVIWEYTFPGHEEGGHDFSHECCKDRFARLSVPFRRDNLGCDISVSFIITPPPPLFPPPQPQTPRPDHHTDSVNTPQGLKVGGSVALVPTERGTFRVGGPAGTPGTTPATASILHRLRSPTRPTGGALALHGPSGGGGLVGILTRL